MQKETHTSLRPKMWRACVRTCGAPTNLNIVRQDTSPLYCSVRTAAMFGICPMAAVTPSLWHTTYAPVYGSCDRTVPCIPNAQHCGGRRGGDTGDLLSSASAGSAGSPLVAGGSASDCPQTTAQVPTAAYSLQWHSPCGSRHLQRVHLRYGPIAHCTGVLWWRCVVGQMRNCVCVCADAGTLHSAGGAATASPNANACEHRPVR